MTGVNNSISRKMAETSDEINHVLGCAISRGGKWLIRKDGEKINSTDKIPKQNISWNYNSEFSRNNREWEGAKTAGYHGTRGSEGRLLWRREEWERRLYLVKEFPFEERLSLWIWYADLRSATLPNMDYQSLFSLPTSDL